ncbi:hypothetical protein ZIOFF_034078 [Zingiber officinale]|uniref:Alpha-amylase n=1 Tax=Zingiber officinale TaxID=94328 RepID=A0A8J5GRF1_ZINOF|nr:hypothetical protein ZIOFF_034078 [Zingiber officinale]
MALVHWKPVLHRPPQETPGVIPRWKRRSFLGRQICRPRPVFRSICCSKSSKDDRKRTRPIVSSGATQTPSLADVDEAKLLFTETFPLKRPQTIALQQDMILLLHICSEWDQPPPEMRPPDSVVIKDYAIETPLKKGTSLSEGHIIYEAQIDFDSNIPISAIHFVLKEEETGAWFQHKGRDFRISFTDSSNGGNTVDGSRGFSIWPGALNQIPGMLLKAEGSTSKQKYSKDTKILKHDRIIARFNKEFPILKEEFVSNFMTVSLTRSEDTHQKFVQFDTDLPGDVVVHWGVCKADGRKWEIPTTPHPPRTKIFRQKALQTVLQPKEDGQGNWGLFPIDEETSAVVFVLKLNEYTWLNNMGADFFVPTGNVINSLAEFGSALGTETSELVNDSTGQAQVTAEKDNSVTYSYEIIKEIKNLVSDISSERSKGAKSKEAQESILQEIEKLAAEAYSIFRSSIPSYAEPVTDSDLLKPAVELTSGTGSGYEILCQGFNWESHRSGKWYAELSAKTVELSSLGFTVVWLPPPTESVSPEGYMPKDLYNLDSRYGNIDELKQLVKRFHEVGVKVLGDVVLNHRCAHYQNKNGVWNIFGGRLNWDDRAVVADDPHFQGRGNKSSGDSFHAAPNIDHSQDFVRNDLKEWLCWLRKEVGYDGWRLDFVRGFWGGYVKDYIEASEPYFAVGEYWDSLSYTYGEMDHNQDAHRQRIIDWINATNGTAGAFDVTTKGILHTALERCEYWRLCDEHGKPPGVVGWWPSRAVTFIENHDTGSTQGHWRFPSGKEMQGYAYILTHPGTPAVFYDHIFSHCQHDISKLISIRNRNKINCRSMLKITKAERDVYAAVIDEKVAVKIGPGHYEPPNGSKRWNVAAEGVNYRVWETS